MFSITLQENVETLSHFIILSIISHRCPPWTPEPLGELYFLGADPYVGVGVGDCLITSGYWVVQICDGRGWRGRRGKISNERGIFM